MIMMTTILEDAVVTVAVVVVAVTAPVPVAGVEEGVGVEEGGGKWR